MVRQRITTAAPHGARPWLLLAVALAGPLAAAAQDAQQVADRALLMAVGAGRATLVEYALEHGAAPDARTPDRRRETALMLAARSGRIDLVEPLLAAGADVNALAADGWSALMQAVFMQLEG